MLRIAMPEPVCELVSQLIAQLEIISTNRGVAFSGGIRQKMVTRCKNE